MDEILEERGKTYGNFAAHAAVSQALQQIMVSGYAKAHPEHGIEEIDADMRESLTMIATKIARIVNGDPTHVDSWVDIAGYATLVADRLKGGPDEY